MPRITRVEPSVAYQGANMPTASGDWGAPGKALASMGNALAGLGEAFSAEQNQEDEYKTKLALVNFHTQQQQDFDRYKAEYTGDPTQFQAGWNQRYQQSWNTFAPTLPQNPKTLRSANLHGATLGGSLSTHALGQQQTLVHGQNVASVEATINSTLGAIDAADPEKMDQVLDQTIAGINAIIDQAPPGMLTESDKARMRGQAASLALSRMEQKFRDAKIDPMPALKGTIQKWTTDPRLQQAPQPMGPRSDAGPQGGLTLGPGKIAAVTDQEDRKFTPDGFGDRMTGAITVNGNTYRFVNGGSKRGSIPLREYQVLEYTSGDERAARGHSYTKDAFVLSDAQDDAPSTKDAAPRQGLLIHSAKRGVTAGCIGIEGDFEAFKSDMQAEMERNGGKPVTLSLGTPKMFSGGSAPQAGAGGSLDRSSFASELDDPKVRSRLLALTEAEVGSQGPEAQQAFMETIFNRAAARKQSLWDTMHGSYFPDITHERTASKTGDPSLERKYGDIYKSVYGGSNIANYATGNASGTVGFAGGPKTAEFNGERFGIEGSDKTWAESARSRKDNTIGDGKTGESVKVADASGKIGAGEYLREKAGDNTIGSHGVSPDTMKRMRPSVQSEMLQRMTTGWKTWEGMQQAWAKEIETRVKAELDVAQSGYEPKPENIAAIKAMIAKSPEVARQYGLDKAVEMIDAAVAKAGIIRQMTPQALEMAVRQMDAAMSGPGGADQAMIEQKKQLEKTLATTRKAINDDPMTWAAQAKIPVPLPMPALEPGAKAKFEQPWTVANVQPIDFSSPDVVTQLKMRADVARGVGQYYNQQPQFFTAPERDALKDVFRTGGAPMLHVLGKITEAFGNDAVLAMKEFAKDAPEAAMMGKIMAEGGDAKLLEDSSKGLHLRVAEGDKFISHVDKKIVEPDVSSIMPALARTPGLQDPAIRMANAVYEYRHRYMGKDKFDQDLYLKTLKEVLGETRDKDGNVYGGVGEQNAGWFDFKFANKVIVPPSVRQDKFDDLIGSIRDVDLMTLGQPRHGDGTPLTAKDVRGATWQSVGSGKYGLVLGTTANGNPQYAWDTEKNAPFVLDLNLIMPGLRKRVPSVFRP